MWQRILFAFIGVLLGVFSWQQPARAEIVDVTVASLGPACAICNGMLEGKLKHVTGIEKVITNLKDSTFTLIPKAGLPLDVAAVKKAVKDSGYGFRFIELTMKGMVEDSSGVPTFKESSSGQTFQLVQGENSKTPPANWVEIKTASADGKNPVQIKGMAYPGQPMDALTPSQVSAVH